MRAAARLALVVLVAAPPAAATAQPRFLPPPTAGKVAAAAALTFTVSVCLDDFEYSIGCSERSSVEAAHRLEQLYLDDYATGSAAGSLRIWFAVKAEPSEQSSFLREVENRAIESAFRKLQEDAAQQPAAARAFTDTPGGNAQAAREFAQELQRWHDDAGAEARTGVNWSHDWAGRTHNYKPGQALRDLARLGNISRQSGGQD
jgi:hypothetical protein